MPVYTGGAMAAAIASADATHDSRERTVAAVINGVKLGVAEAYIGVLRAQSALDVARSATASLRAHANDVEDMRRSGAVPTNDYLAAAVSLADAEQRELQADAALDDRARRLQPRDGSAARRGRGASSRCRRRSRPRPAPRRWRSSSRAHARAAPSSLRWTRRPAPGPRAPRRPRPVRRPQLIVSGGYTYLDNDVLNRRDYWSVALGVRWSPFDGGRTRETAVALRRQSDAAVAERNDEALAVELEVTTAWHLRDAARARLDVADERRAASRREPARRPRPLSQRRRHEHRGARRGSAADADPRQSRLRALRRDSRPTCGSRTPRAAYEVPMTTHDSQRRGIDAVRLASLPALPALVALVGLGRERGRAAARRASRSRTRPRRASASGTARSKP